MAQLGELDPSSPEAGDGYCRSLWSASPCNKKARTPQKELQVPQASVLLHVLKEFYGWGGGGDRDLVAVTART